MPSVARPVGVWGCTVEPVCSPWVRHYSKDPPQGFLQVVRDTLDGQATPQSGGTGNPQLRPDDAGRPIARSVAWKTEDSRRPRHYTLRYTSPTPSDVPSSSPGPRPVHTMALSPKHYCGASTGPGSPAHRRRREPRRCGAGSRWGSRLAVER